MIMMMMIIANITTLASSLQCLVGDGNHDADES